MNHLKQFLTSMEKVSQSNPMAQRWLYGTKELQSQLCQRLIRLCKYPDLIPDKILYLYANVLLEALKEERSPYGFKEKLVSAVTKFTDGLTAKPPDGCKALRERKAIQILATLVKPTPVNTV